MNTNQVHINDTDPSASVSSEIPIPLSKYTHALIKSWKTGQPQTSVSTNRISVSQTVSFLAFLYERLRNAVEFREEHLIRRATIERILKRRMILNENGREIAEPLIKELLWARYYDNNTIGEEKITEIQTTIDKYFFLRNELAAGRKSSEQEKIWSFILEVLSCEIEERLSPDPKRESFTNYVYQIIRPHIVLTRGKDEIEKDIQVYIAVHRTLDHSDDPIIRYHLLKLMIPQITEITWKSADKVLPKLYDVYIQIENQLHHPFADKTRNIIKKHIPPFLILRDVFEQNPHTIESILSDEVKLKYKVDESCRKRYDESRVKLRTTAVRSFIYILLTKVIFAFLLEIPYDVYLFKKISYIPIAINILFPPTLMGIIILTVSLPGDDNTKRIYEQIKSIIDIDPDGPGQLHSTLVIDKKPRVHGLLFNTVFSSLYAITYLVSFGSIILLLTFLKFSPLSQAIFIFFVTLVLFFTYRVIQITQEYRVVESEGIFSPISDFFFLPFIKVGQWLAGEVLTRFNILIFVFDLIIEMPFKAVAEVFDEWVHFVRVKKEEIV